MRKRILLINPPIHDFSAYDLWMKPLGLLYAGAALESVGYQVRLVNAMDRLHPKGRGSAARRVREGRFGCGEFFAEEIPRPGVFAHIPRRFRRYGLPLGVLREEIQSQRHPDLIAVTSMMTYWYPGVFEAIALAKEAFPGVPVILGGVYATLCTQHARSHSGADVVVTGPAEETLLDAVAELLGNHPGRVSWEDLRPAYHLLTRLESASVLTSRGCPFRCSYCASRLLWDGFVQREPERVADEIESYVRSGVRDVAFYDDALLLRAGDHLLEILRILEDRRVRARFHAPNGLHVRMITPEVARALRAGGFETLRLSFETASETRQKDSGGKVDSQDLRTGVETLLAAGFARRQMEVYIMFGLPGQHVGEVVDTIAFVHTCGGRVKLVQFSPIPGTPEFERSATAHPALRAEPLLQNKTAFHQLGGPLGLRTYEALKLAINTLNAANDAGRTLGGRELSRALRFLRTEKGSGPRQEAGGRQTPFAQDH